MRGDIVPPKIIFDMDGVITGEERYWDAAALAVWELLYSKRYLGLQPPPGMPLFGVNVSPEEISLIRKLIFQDDKLIAFFKQRAVNSNWDLAFLTFSFQLVQLIKKIDQTETLQEYIVSKGMEVDVLPSFSQLLPNNKHNLSLLEGILHYDWAVDASGPRELMQKQLRLLSPALEEALKETFSPYSPLWKGVQRIFQEWYFGEEKFQHLFYEPATKGKQGLVYSEKPVLPEDQVKETLAALRDMGWCLGIATGRPYSELYQPLKEMDLWQYFDPTSVVTFTEVEKAEELLKKDLGGKSLSKPHPFSFLKAFWGENADDRKLFEGSVPPPPRGKCWVVGDSPADLLGAQRMGALFVGVLTGHGGTAQEELFQRKGASVVIPDITELPPFLRRKKQDI